MNTILTASELILWMNFDSSHNLWTWWTVIRETDAQCSDCTLMIPSDYHSRAPGATTDLLPCHSGMMMLALNHHSSLHPDMTGTWHGRLADNVVIMITQTVHAVCRV